MHDGSIAAGDSWLAAHLSDYADSPINHYSVLATVQEIYHLPKSGQAATGSPISGVWAD